MIDKLNLELNYLVTSLWVTNPIGECATLWLRCDQLEFDLLGHLFACSLHVFDFMGFGIILGMDWLSEHDANIFFQARKISLRHPDSSDQIVFTTEGSRGAVFALLCA